MSSWNEIADALRSAFGAVEEVGPWLRVSVAGDGGEARVAIRPGELFGIDVAVLLGYIAPVQAMSPFVAMEANGHIDGATLVLANGHFALRLVVPFAVLAPATVQDACARLAAAARAIRDLARADRRRTPLFGHYAD